MHFLAGTRGCGRKNENDLPALALHPHRRMQHGQRLLFSRKGCAVPVAASSGDKSGGKGTASPLGMGIRGSRRFRREARTEGGLRTRDPVTTRSLQNEVAQDLRSVEMWVAAAGSETLHKDCLLNVQGRLGQSTVQAHP